MSAVQAASAPVPSSSEASAVELKDTEAGKPTNGNAPAVKPMTIPTLAGGRPDRAAFDKEQDALTARIEKLQLSNNDVRAKISGFSKGGADNDKKAQLRQQMDTLRDEQAENKGSRQKIFTQLKNLQDSRQRKVQELQAARSKAMIKSPEDLETRISSLEAKIDSGSMKIVDEKKALAEISSLKKSRKLVESFSEQQAAIDEDKKKIDSIRASLDQSGSKEMSEKYNQLREQLNEMNNGQTVLKTSRDTLFAKRNELSKQIDELWSQKKANYTEWREASERHRQKINNERQRRIDREKNERAAQEHARRLEEAERLREGASAPAFEREIEDCKTLIAYLENVQGSSSTTDVAEPALGEDRKSAVPGKSEPRKVNDDIPEGAVMLKPKDEEDNSYFVASKGGKKNKKGRKQGGNAPSEGSSSLHLPMSTMSALFAMNVTPPTSKTEIPRTVEAIREKCKYYEENEASQTQKNIEEAEKRIAKLQEKAEAAKQENGKQEETNKGDEQ